MHILILPTAYPNIYNDHSSIFVQDQAEALSKNGVNVSVVGAIPISFKYILKHRFLKFGIYEYKKNSVNVRLFLFPSVPKMRFLSNFIRDKINKSLLRRYYESHQIDLIHLHNSVAGNIVILMKEQYNIPYMVTEHSSAFARGLVSQREMKKYKWVYQKSSYNIAVSKTFCRLVEDIFDLEFNYLPNVVNSEYFSPKEDASKKDFQFINIANLNKNKNQILLIRAFSKLFSENKNIKLSILGGGLEYKNLQNEIDTLHMQEQINLFGFAPREQVLEQLHHSDAFVLSSKYETFGVVLIEAMSCGLPVIATKCGGPESIIENDELGILVENDDLEELSNAMKYVYENREKYESKKIRNYVVDNFSEKAISTKLINIYKKVLNEAN